MSVPAPSDDDLVARSCDGDERAFGDLVGRHQDRVFNVILRLVGGYDDAVELAQETFLNAFRGLKRFHGGARFSTWLYRIAVNTTYSHLRRRAVRPTAMSFEAGGEQRDSVRREVAAETDSPLDVVQRKEEVELIENALRQLDAEARQVIVLRDVEGLDYGEIAEVLECPRGTVKSRIHRARQALRRALRPQIEESHRSDGP